jgi:hypothetical protein
MFRMTATIEIPDDLYRKMEAKTARTGERLKEVAVSLFDRWVKEDSLPEAPATSAAQWLEQWVQLGAETCKGLPASPTTRDLLQDARNRNER